MFQERAKRFMEALAQLEERGDGEPLVRLCAEVSSAGMERTFQGPEAARQVSSSQALASVPGARHVLERRKGAGWCWP